MINIFQLILLWRINLFVYSLTITICLICNNFFSSSELIGYIQFFLLVVHVNCPLTPAAGLPPAYGDPAQDHRVGHPVSQIRLKHPVVFDLAQDHRLGHPVS